MSLTKEQKQEIKNLENRFAAATGVKVNLTKIATIASKGKYDKAGNTLDNETYADVIRAQTNAQIKMYDKCLKDSIDLPYTAAWFDVVYSSAMKVVFNGSVPEPKTTIMEDSLVFSDDEDSEVEDDEEPEIVVLVDALREHYNNNPFYNYKVLLANLKREYKNEEDPLFKVCDKLSKKLNKVVERAMPLEGEEQTPINDIVEEVAEEYMAAREQYNNLGFFGKWLTSNGSKLRAAMNNCRNFIKEQIDINNANPENEKIDLTASELLHQTAYNQTLNSNYAQEAFYENSGLRRKIDIANEFSDLEIEVKFSEDNSKSLVQDKVIEDDESEISDTDMSIG